MTLAVRRLLWRGWEGRPCGWGALPVYVCRDAGKRRLGCTFMVVTAAA